MSGPGAALPRAQRDAYLLKNPACVVDGRIDDVAIDHKRPRSQGGSDDEDNLQTLCRWCNTQNGVKSNEEWLRYWAETERPSIFEALSRARS